MEKLEVFVDFNSNNLGEVPPTKEWLKEINQQLSQKCIPKDCNRLPIHADHPDSHQGELILIPYINSKNDKILYAILVLFLVKSHAINRCKWSSIIYEIKVCKSLFARSLGTTFSRITAALSRYKQYLTSPTNQSSRQFCVIFYGVVVLKIGRQEFFFSSPLLCIRYTVEQRFRAKTMAPRVSQAHYSCNISQYLRNNQNTTM